MSKERKLFLILLVSLLLNIALGIFLGNTLSKEHFYATAEETAELYPYLSKRIFIENQNDILINFIPLRDEIREYVASVKSPLGIYFEYLPSGISIGVNDRDDYAIASLVKIPLAMSIYRKIEQGKLRLDQEVILEAKDVDRGFGDLWRSELGTSFLVEELVEKLLIDSDNTASKMLKKLVSEEDLNKVFESLDIETNVNGNTLTVSPKSYSSVLRSLYLASYLNRDSSQKILDILTRTKFNDKIASGVPKNTKVAHKIGIWDLDADGGIVYSDCGIFYVPKRPYMLCIMTKTSENQAREHMNHLSSMVYGYVNKVKK